LKLITFIFALLISFISVGQDEFSAQSTIATWQNESNDDTVRWQALLDYYNTSDKSDDSLIVPLLNEFVKETKSKRHPKWYVASRIIQISIRNRHLQSSPEKEFQTLIEETKLIGDTSLISQVYTSLTLDLFYRGENAKKLEYEIEHLKIIESNKKETEYYIQLLHRIGNGYESLKKYKKAREYYSLALNQAIINKDAASISGTHINIAGLEGELGNDSLQEYHFEQALQYAIEDDNPFLYSLIKVYLSGIYSDKGENKAANKLIEEALDYFKNNKHSYWLSYSYQTKGKIRYNEGSLFDAINYCEKSLKYSELTGSNLVINSSLKDLHKYYAEKGNYKLAYETRDRYEALNDSIYNSTKSEETATLLNQYVNDKIMLTDSLERKRISDLEKVEHEKELSAQANMKYLFGVGFGFLLILALILFRGFHQKKKDNEVISIQKEEVEQQKNEIEAQHQEIKDSITYAKRIQTAILPPNKLIKEFLTNSFVWYKPKDVVAGDFYWMEPKIDRVLFAAADCTGHGVPGAMVSVICHNSLNRSTREFGLSDPGEILSKTRELVIAEFEKSEDEVKDGMDIALCSLDGNKLKYAGAHNPLWIIRKGAAEVEEIKADKQPIGKYAEPKPFSTHEVELNTGDSFYTFSDGFADQFGGEKGKKFKSKNFKALLLSIQHESRI
jgi:tetratricopeptide (TPR) repeat protein